MWKEKETTTLFFKVNSIMKRDEDCGEVNGSDTIRGVRSGRMIRLKIDILGISEVRWPNNGDFWSNEFRIIYLGGGVPGRAGIGFVLNKKW